MIIFCILAETHGFLASLKYFFPTFINEACLSIQADSLQ